MVTDRTVKVNVKGDISDFNRAMLAGAASAKAFTRELDTSTDRTANLTQSILAIGPALVPIAAAGVPALAGLSNQLGFAAAGAGVMALAFSGVGDALKATNDFAIEPTDANLQKMQQSLSELGPAGREFVGFLQEIRPELQGLQDAAQAGFFPGAQAGIEDLMTLLPQAERIVSTIATSMGDLVAEAGENLAGPKWEEFFDFLETEARPTLIEMGRTLGNFAEGFANLWMAFAPVSRDFSSSFLNMSRDFAAWSDGLAETDGFQEFVDYIQRVGPKAWDTLGSLGNALLQVVEAAAPVGEAALPAIEAMADVIATIADSDVGPVLIGAAAGISAISRAVALYNVANGSALAGLFGRSALGGAARAAKDLPAASRAWLQFDAAAARAKMSADDFAAANGRMGASLRGTAKLAGGAAGLAFVMSDLDDKMGLTNTATLAMAGALAGPWGAAIGGGVGLVMDLTSGTSDLVAALNQANEAIEKGTLEQQAEAISKVKAAMAEDDGGFLKDVNMDALDDLESRYQSNVRAAQDLQFAEAGLGDAMNGSSDSTRNYTASLLDNVAAKNAARDQALAAANAELAYEQAIDAAGAAAEKNGQDLDKSTETGRNNLTALYDLAGAWNNLEPAQQNAEGASKRARAEFIRAARQMGANKAEAKALADQYLDIPSDVKTKITLSGAGTAAAQAGSILGQLNAINGMDVSASVRIGLTGADLGAALGKINRIKNSANGNLFEFYANGGTREQHVAQIAPANTIRVWAEPETGGEAYIPLAPAKRERSLAIWEETGRRLGVQGFADGGITSLDINRQRAAIRDIEDQLDEKETVGKGKSRRRRFVARGLDRTILRQELAEARRELRDLRNGTAAKTEAATERANVLESTRADFGRNFTIGSLSSAAAVDRSLSSLLADSLTFTSLLAELDKKGAPPWLLQQLTAAGPTKGAIRLARQYATDSVALASINARSMQIGQATNLYAGLTASPQFLGGGSSWGPQQSAALAKAAAQIKIDVHPAPGQSEAAVAQQVAGQLMWRMTG